MRHNKAVQDLALAPNSEQLVTICQNSELRLWDVNTGDLLVSKNHESTGGDIMPDVVYTPDGSDILCIRSSQLHRLNAETLEIERHVPEGSMDDVDTDPTGRVLATVSHLGSDAKLALRDPVSLAELRSVLLRS